MMKKLTCIVCPCGCALEITEENGKYTVTGNTCKRGADYAISEMTHPVRTLTTTVFIKNRNTVLPVKAVGISKSKMSQAMQVIDSSSFDAPIKSGDVLIKNLCGECDLTATSSIE